MMQLPRSGYGLLPMLVLSLAGCQMAVARDGGCTMQASPACLQSFALPAQAGRMHYYASRQPGADGGPAPQSALVVVHGHARDADRSFNAGLQAATRAGRLQGTLVIAPLYQVPQTLSGHCRTPSVPIAQADDAVWTCGGWLAGAPSLGNHPISAYAALDALVAELVRQWPSVRTLTLAGFSAGAQMLQHSVAFAAAPPAGLKVRYVIADPGSWLYFDPVRPQPRHAGQITGWEACGSGGKAACTFTFQAPLHPEACPAYNAWKYGTQSLPAYLGRNAAQARAHYAAAQVDYLEGSLDSSSRKGAYYPILDKSCAAMLQGPFRLQRGLAYAAYERAVLKPQWARRLVVVPGCTHDVGCVLPSEAARPVLFAPAP